MVEPPEGLPHLTLLDGAESQDFHRPGGGDPKIRSVERRAHGDKLRGDLASAFQDAQDRGEVTNVDGEPSIEELRALGVVLLLQGADAAFPLKLESLDSMSRHKENPRPRWLLLSVRPATGKRLEQAMVWVSDEYRAAFLKLFEDYLDEQKVTEKGNPKNRELVANIGAIRSVVLRDLWQSGGEPPQSGTHWWELWLRATEDAVRLAEAYAEANGLPIAERSLTLGDRITVWVRASWSQLQTLPFTSVPLAEIRRPEFVDTIEDLSRDDQDEYVGDLRTRLSPASADAPAVCHLDTGVRRTHALIEDSLSEGDLHSVVGGSASDRMGHGTRMAGLALYGPLDPLLTGVSKVTLRHRLESVKLWPDPPASNDPLAFGLVTAQATAAPEATATRRRVFCMPVTAEPEADPGEPSLWSATVDALAVGTEVGQSDHGIELLGPPDPDAARLFVISAGNIDVPDFRGDYRAACDLSPVQDPANAWNALTVGAHTDLVDTPVDPSFAGWRPLSAAGDISPYSRTSVLFSAKWPIKPEICMEGGNVLTNGVDFRENLELLSVRTTEARDDLAIGSANATSAATAQAARLAALAMATYPSYWPETIRALLVHEAKWTPAMSAEVEGVQAKAARLILLRRYGWGVPDESAVLNSSRQAVTMITQDEFIPFEGDGHKARVFRLHRLPWPAEQLRQIADADVQLRITLSYFIEPTASRRGWRRRYAYPSHGLRFDLKTPTETTAAFITRVNRDAQAEEDGDMRSSSGSERWLLGPRGATLARCTMTSGQGREPTLPSAGLSPSTR